VTVHDKPQEEQKIIRRGNPVESEKENERGARTVGGNSSPLPAQRRPSMMSDGQPGAAANRPPRQDFLRIVKLSG
jgi:hypothetical protein